MYILNKTTHELLLLPKYNKTQLNSLLNISILFFSDLYKHLKKYQANQLDISITTSTKAYHY